MEYTEGTLRQIIYPCVLVSAQARQRKAIVDGLKESVLEFNDGVAGTSPADVMQLMMVTQ